MNARLEFACRAGAFGLLPYEVEKLLRYGKTLERWAVDECNGDIQWDETTREFFRHYGRGASGPFQVVKIRNRKLSTVNAIMSIANAHGLKAMFQCEWKILAIVITALVLVNTAFISQNFVVA